MLIKPHLIKKNKFNYNFISTYEEHNINIMPGRRCAVFSCNNSRVVTKRKGETVVYHAFPKGNDLVSSTIKKEWIRRCARADKWNPNNSQVCSVHFTSNDYERDLQNELLGK
jgi:hypothetical protein